MLPLPHCLVLAAPPGEEAGPLLRAAVDATTAAAARAARGLVANAVALTPADLRRPAVRAALAARGVTRLPALLRRGAPPAEGAAAVAAALRAAAPPPRREQRPQRGRRRPDEEDGDGADGGESAGGGDYPQERGGYPGEMY